MLKILGLWSLEERSNRADILEVYKMYNGASAVPFGEMFEISGNTRTRGHDLKLAKDRRRLDMRKLLFSERVVCRWNSSDKNTIDKQSINNFKDCLSRRKNIEKGMFMDPWSDKPYGLIRTTSGASPSTAERVWPHPVSHEKYNYKITIIMSWQSKFKCISTEKCKKYGRIRSQRHASETE